MHWRKYGQTEKQSAVNFRQSSVRAGLFTEAACIKQKVTPAGSTCVYNKNFVPLVG